MRAHSKNQLDPSSAWVEDEFARIPPTESEPYDWTLDDDAAPSLQLVPIPPPVPDSSARARPPETKKGLPEASVLIPIGKVVTGHLFGKNASTPRQKYLISSVLLLLLAVIGLFVFAYIAR